VWFKTWQLAWTAHSISLLTRINNDACYHERVVRTKWVVAHLALRVSSDAQRQLWKCLLCCYYRLFFFSPMSLISTSLFLSRKAVWSVWYMTCYPCRQAFKSRINSRPQVTANSQPCHVDNFYKCGMNYGKPQCSPYSVLTIQFSHKMKSL
jgi:hypothetical protein